MENINKLQIYQSMYAKLYLYSHKMLANYEDASDVLQKVFIYLNNKDEKTFTDSKHVENWLIWLTKSESICFRKRRAKYIAIEEEEMNAKICERDSPFETLCNNDLKSFFFRELPKALDKLTPFQKACIEMKYLQGKDTQEIVEKLKSTKSCVNKTISRSKHTIKTYFQKTLA
jgi:RNA polymerase sigma factor (sigma-70 family)